jgi:hypothetical protein
MKPEAKAQPHPPPLERPLAQTGITPSFTWMDHMPQRLQVRLLTNGSAPLCRQGRCWIPGRMSPCTPRMDIPICPGN